MLSLDRRGATLVELMISTAIMGIVILGFVGSFAIISKAVRHAKSRTLSANPLTLEKIEVLKKTSYHRLLVSTATVASTEFPAGENFTYDTSANPPETIVVGDISFIRRVLVEKVTDSGTSFTAVSPTAADTGVKRITVYTIWQEDGAWRKYGGSTLYTNPNLSLVSCTLSGTVSGPSGTLANARVDVLQNPSYFGVTNAAGDYSFSVTPSSYTLRASLAGYYPSYSGLTNVPAGATVDTDFTLGAMGSGTVRGTVWVSSTILISQVVASSGMVGALESEYVELYNPTTYAWTLSGASFELIYREKNSGGPASAIALNHLNSAFPAGSFYLIASTSPVSALGVSKTADAVYTGCAAPCDQIKDDSDGGLGIRFPAAAAYWDRVSWAKGGGPDPPADLTEGNAFTVTGGLGDNEQLVRMTSTGSVSSSFGNAYDIDDSSKNLVHADPLIYAPRNSGDSLPSISGRPAYSAVVSADDGLSSSTQALRLLASALFPYAEFTLNSVATGTWRVTLTSGSAHLSVTNIAVTAGATTLITNAATIPAWPSAGYNVALLSSTITTGFLTGRVLDASAVALPSIVVTVGGASATTDGNGRYTLVVTTGTSLTVEANPTSATGYNALYVTHSTAGWTATPGVLTVVSDFTLASAGVVHGKITNNGTDAIPNIPVVALRSGFEMGSALSNSNGYFSIPGLSTGSYNIAPQIDTGEAVTPSSPSVTVNGTVWSATFTLTNSPGTLTGYVKKNSVSIKTGVLIAATTGTIASDPPSNTSTLRSGGLIYYSISSLSNGSYSLPVRGGAGTYNVYAWFTTFNGETPTTTRQTGTATVTAGQTTTVNFDF